jgi:hypothetical protein
VRLINSVIVFTWFMIIVLLFSSTHIPLREELFSLLRLPS